MSGVESSFKRHGMQFKLVYRSSKLPRIIFVRKNNLRNLIVLNHDLIFQLKSLFSVHLAHVGGVVSFGGHIIIEVNRRVIPLSWLVWFLNVYLFNHYLLVSHCRILLLPFQVSFVDLRA